MACGDQATPGTAAQSPPAEAPSGAAPSTGPTTTTAPTTTTTAPTTTTTTAPSTTTTTEPPQPDMLRPGDSGPRVRALQERLADLGYWLGQADGAYGDTTRQAVLAFQKVEGLARDGIAGPQTLGHLDGAGRPAARGDGDLLEIDLDRQVAFVVESGRVVHVLNTSTGSAGHRTPPGRFTIGREIDGWRHAPLGTLYRPKYFNRGIAFHGFPSVPAHPASHGCARVSNPAMDMLWASGRAEVGTTVWVY